MFKSWYLNSHPQKAIFKAARLLRAGCCHQRDADSEQKMLAATSQHVPTPPHGVGVPGQGARTSAQKAQRTPHLGTRRGMSYALKHLNHCSLF